MFGIPYFMRMCAKSYPHRKCTVILYFYSCFIIPMRIELAKIVDKAIISNLDVIPSEIIIAPDHDIFPNLVPPPRK